MEEILSQLISIVQDTAPALWAIARRQVISTAVTMAIWFVICLISTVVLVRVAEYGRDQSREDNYSDWDVGVAFSIAGAVATLVIAAILACSIVQYLVNPEYYTIKVLLSLIRT